MLRIAVLNKISRDILDKQFHQFQEVTLEEHPNLVFVRSHDLNNTDLPKSIIAIGRAGTGVNNIPLEQCNQKGIAVFNAPGANANAVKELVILTLLHDLRSAALSAAEEIYEVFDISTGAKLDFESIKGKFVGKEIAGKVLFVIGLGKIGMMVAETCEALGMTVIGYDPFMKREHLRNLHISIVPEIRLGLKDADYVTLHSALTPETTGMVNSEFLNQMKRGAKLLNFARGEMVDVITLRHALQNRHIDQYISDFPDPAFAEEVLNGQAMFFPHLGASTHEAETNAVTMVAKQLDDFFRFGEVKNSVNFPEIIFPVSPGKSQHRILVHHTDTPGMLAGIMTIVKDLGYNIAGSLNKSNKARTHAVTILDLDFSGKPPVLCEVTRSIEKMDGVTKARVCDLDW